MTTIHTQDDVARAAATVIAKGPRKYGDGEFTAEFGRDVAKIAGRSAPAFDAILRRAGLKVLATPLPPHTEESALDLRDAWLTGKRLDEPTPRLGWHIAEM